MIHSNLQSEHLWKGRKSNQMQKIHRNKVDNHKISRLKLFHFHLNGKKIIEIKKKNRIFIDIRTRIGLSYFDDLPFNTIILFTHKSRWTTVVYGESSTSTIFLLNLSHARNCIIISRNFESELFIYCNSEQMIYSQFQQIKSFKNEIEPNPLIFLYL